MKLINLVKALSENLMKIYTIELDHHWTTKGAFMLINIIWKQ